jgi:hypothetical protein
MAARAWTYEQREAQRQRILERKPWLKSTGATTPEGKAVVSQNAKGKTWKHCDTDDYYRRQEERDDREHRKNVASWTASDLIEQTIKQRQAEKAKRMASRRQKQSDREKEKRLAQRMKRIEHTRKHGMFGARPAK